MEKRMKDILKPLAAFLIFSGWIALFFMACFSNNGWNVLGALILLWPLHLICVKLGDEEPRQGNPEPRVAPFDGDGG